MKPERLETLFRSRKVRVERIVSRGHATPGGEWLVQAKAEWVMVLEGRARLRFKGASRAVALKKGDAVFIPARKAHRVEWTRPGRPTVWLAVHF